MTAECRWICECGHAFARIPIQPEESNSDGPRPARFLLTCKNPCCEHHKRTYQQPFNLWRLKPAEGARAV